MEGEVWDFELLHALTAVEKGRANSLHITKETKKSCVGNTNL